jgi:membrane protein implicated in regulation of membrane protease activity
LEVNGVAVAWLVFGVVLFLVELRHLAFYVLFGAVGCFAAAIVAAIAPSAIPLQVAVAVVVAVGGVVTVRPSVSRAFAHRREGHVAIGVHGGLVGQEALTLDEVGDVRKVGHVRLTGERWLATSGSGTTIPAGTKVLVTAIRGTTLVVWPVSDLGLPGGEPPDSDGAPDGADGRTT